MQGFVIGSVDEETGEVQQYWDGIVMVDDIAKSRFLTDKIEARRTLGNLQSQTPGSEFKLVAARLAITLAAPVPVQA